MQHAGQTPHRGVVREEGDVEGVAETHEARAFHRGIDVEAAGQKRWLVGHDADRAGVQVGEADQLFGSVTSKDIAEALAVQNFTIDRRKIHLEEPIRQLGEFKVPVKLHKDVTAEITVVVVKEEEV
jgi:ribosomal protein L9